MAIEKNILNKLQVQASKLGHRLFRNTVGFAWAGETTKLKNGDIIVHNPRAITYGLAPGSGDLIGGTRITITDDMVGRTVFVFTNYEVKANNTTVKKEQQNFHEMVISLGGISLIERFKSEDIGGNKYSDAINKFQGIKSPP